jgi:hypothetical protein
MIWRALASAVFLAVCFFIGGRFHRSDFDAESGLQAAGFGIFALIGIYAIIEVVIIIRWNRRDDGPPSVRRRQSP